MIIERKKLLDSLQQPHSTDPLEKTLMKKSIVIRSGFCGCGCGGRTTFKNGKYKKFINHHSFKKENNPFWKGGKIINGCGYVTVANQEHHRASVAGRVPEHILIVESILKKPLPEKAEIHHTNEIRSDNSNNNLVVCEDRKYHALLHIRTKALKACGHGSWLKCWVCKKYDQPENINKHSHAHCVCFNHYRKLLRGQK